MAASIAGPAQGAGGEASPGDVGDIIVIPEISNTIQLQHTIQQVQSTVADVNGDSSGQSSPTVDAQHTYITVSNQDDPWRDAVQVKSDPLASDQESTLGQDDRVWIYPVQVKSEAPSSDQESEGGTSVNYHVQYVDPQEIYTQPHEHQHIENLRTFPVYTASTAPTDAWAAEFSFGVVGDEAETPASPATPAQPPRMAPATVQWLLDNYETAEETSQNNLVAGVSLPRSTLYAHYLRHCNTHRLDPVNAASFGKLIRSVFVGLRTRRLGTRGNSKYHYYGIRAKTTATDSPPTAQECSLEDKQQLLAQEGEGDTPDSSGTVGGAVGPHRQYLGTVTPPEPPILCVTEMPPECLIEHLNALHRHHKEHGVQFLEAVAALDTASVERSRRAFWRRPPPDLCRKILYRLAHNKDVVAWLKKAELALYQKAVELLLPDVLRPIPSQLTQSIRNFAKSVEAALSAGCAGAPAPAARAHLSAAAAMAGALRRYTSLNHLAQAARAVLHNHTQAHQMLSDLNRVDFRVVREQAAWACACASPNTALALEQDFKATLGRGATLEQWASWLEGCVKKALAPHEKKPEFSSRARRLLLDWSFFSSLVIRELTLRSAASFGSFHLIRLLFDEYVAYLVEKKVAAHEIAPSIAIMHPVDDEYYVEEENRTEMEEEEGEWDWGDEDEDDESDPKKAKLD